MAELAAVAYRRRCLLQATPGDEAVRPAGEPRAPPHAGAEEESRSQRRKRRQAEMRKKDEAAKAKASDMPADGPG